MAPWHCSRFVFKTHLRWTKKEFTQTIMNLTVIHSEGPGLARVGGATILAAGYCEPYYCY